MKRILSLLLFATLFLSQKSWAGYNRYGGDRAVDPIYRSSATSTADDNVSIATGPIVVIGVVVTNPSAGTITLWDASKGLPALSTPIAPIDTSAFKQPGYKVYLSSGLVYTKTGTAGVTIIWDWYLDTHVR